jgi:hypothetical protein
MPISRLTNVADFDTLLGDIRSFLNGAGSWTFNQDLAAPDVASAAAGRILVAVNGDCMVGLRSTQSGSGANRLYMFDGIPPYGSFTTLDTLPGNSGTRVSSAQYTASSDPPARCLNPASAGPFPTATLFSNNPSTYCHVCVQISSGKFRHLSFGNLAKFGTWTGGGFYAMEYWSQVNSSSHQIDDPANGSHSVPFDSSVNQSTSTTLHYENGSFHWCALPQSVLNSVSRRSMYGSVRGGFGTAFRNVQETAFSGLIALNPVTLWPLTSTDTPATTRCAGRVPDMFEVNMKNLIPGQSYFIGVNEYVVFPLSQKGNPSDRLGVENSGYYGLAYLVTP